MRTTLPVYLTLVFCAAACMPGAQDPKLTQTSGGSDQGDVSEKDVAGAIPEPTVVNGLLDTTGKYSSVVALAGCSGTLIDRRVVLTAAHCVTVAKPASGTCSSLMLEPSTASQDVDMTGYVTDDKKHTLHGVAVVHPDFYMCLADGGIEMEPGGAVKVKADFALIILDQDAPAELKVASLAEQAAPGSATIVGFGFSDCEKTNFDGKRRSGDVKLYTKTSSFLYIEPTSGKNQLNMQGDSGGPLLLSGAVAGVSSYHQVPDGSCPNVGAYTNVTTYLSWIKAEITKANGTAPAACAGSNALAVVKVGSNPALWAVHGGKAHRIYSLPSYQALGSPPPVTTSVTQEQFTSCYEVSRSIDGGDDPLLKVVGKSAIYMYDGTSVRPFVNKPAYCACSGISCVDSDPVDFRDVFAFATEKLLELLGGVGETYCSPGATSSCPDGALTTCTEACELAPCDSTPSGCEQPEACTPGAEDKEECGNCGTKTRSCSQDCAWSEFAACTDEGDCTPGEAGECGDSGQRTCNQECSWGQCVETEPPLCAAPAEEQDCGKCGVMTRTCTDGEWSEWSACESEGTCEPGETSACAGGVRTCGEDCVWGSCIPTGGDKCDVPSEEQNCGNCGTRVRTCADNEWSDWSDCQDEGECSPGAEQSCGNAGSQECGSACSWGECVEEAALCVGPSEEDCGSCGLRKRTCLATGWSTWGACLGQGVCAPGDTQACEEGGERECTAACNWGQCTGGCVGAWQQACGNCGLQERSCTGSDWSSWGPCKNQGPCDPGMTGTCPGGGPKECLAGCVWSACGDSTSMKISADGHSVLFKISAFELHDGTPLAEVMAEDNLCGIGFATGEWSFHNQPFVVDDADGDGWLEYPLPAIKVGIAPYDGCVNCTTGIPFRFTLKQCDAPNYPIGGWLQFSGPGDPKTAKFSWVGYDDQCTFTGSLVVSWDGEKYWASGTEATALGCGQ